jgi:hypothetical protein
VGKWKKHFHHIETRGKKVIIRTVLHLALVLDLHISLFFKYCFYLIKCRKDKMVGSAYFIRWLQVPTRETNVMPTGLFSKKKKKKKRPTL